jgi:hypothetical protein
MNRTAKTPSIVPMAVIAKVRFTGPKKISATITNFSITEAVKIGIRVAGTYALYTVNAQTTQSSAPQCRTKSIVKPSLLLAPNTNCKTGLGKRHAASPPAAVPIPDTMSIHSIDDANIDPPNVQPMYGSTVYPLNRIDTIRLATSGRPSAGKIAGVGPEPARCERTAHEMLEGRGSRRHGRSFCRLLR